VGGVWGGEDVKDERKGKMMGAFLVFLEGKWEKVVLLF